VGIREVMQQPIDRITPMPNASPLLLGVINLRGQVIWVADLGQFLGDNKRLNTARSEITVIAIEEQETILGLAVERLGDMEWLDLNKLGSAASIPIRSPHTCGESGFWGRIPKNLKTTRSSGPTPFCPLGGLKSQKSSSR